MVSCFVRTSRFEEYLCVKEAVLLDLLRVVTHHRARLATPIRTVQKIYGEPNSEREPFHDTIFSRARATNNRSLLLIDPSYKINGNDKTKSTTRSSQSSGERDTVIDAHSAVDPVDESQLSKDGTKKDVTLSESNCDKAMSDRGNVSSDVAEEKHFTVQQLGGEKSSPSSSPVGRPSLENNIVLEVALEGSKLTLPIEDDDVAPSTESKELATRRNGNGLTEQTNSKKDENITAVSTDEHKGER